MLRPILWSLALGDVIDSAVAVAIAPTPVTEKPHPTIVQRDNKIKTITLGDVSQYLTYKGGDKAEKRDVVIYPTGIITKLPEKGMHVVFGPDMQQEISKVDCKDQNKLGECQKKIYDLLQGSAMQKHAKRFLLLTFATVQAGLFIFASITAAVAAAGIAYEVEKKIDSVNFDDMGPDGALAQINDIGKATAVAIAVGADNKVMTTITLPSAPAPTHKPIDVTKIILIDKDSDKEKKGSVRIEIADKTAVQLEEYLAVIGLQQAREACKGQKMKRSVTTRSLRKRVDLTEACEHVLKNFAFMVLEETSTTLQALIPANNPMAPTDQTGAILPNIAVGGTLMAISVFRAYFTRHTGLTGESIAKALGSAAAITEIVAHYILTDSTAVQNLNTILLEEDHIVQKKKSDTDCKKDLYCVDDNCKGSVGVLGQTWQFGMCYANDVFGCACKQVSMLTERESWDGYLDDLMAWNQKVLGGSGSSAECAGLDVSTTTQAMADAVRRACSGHSELKRRKRDVKSDFFYSEPKKSDIQWAFDWDDKGGKCNMKCEDAFKPFMEDKKCALANGKMSTSGHLENECGIASYSVDKPEFPNCSRWPDYGAPRGRKEVEAEGGQGTSVDDAIEQFCNDQDGKKVYPKEKNLDSPSRRWGYSSRSVPNRYSFWLKAEYHGLPYCQGKGEETILKTNCKAALRQSMSQCAVAYKTHGRTHGFTARGLGCIDYGVYLSGVMKDDSPPWKGQKMGFPPPYDALGQNGKPHDTQCFDKTASYRSVTNDDLEIAIAAFCKNGIPIQGLGQYGEKMFNWPPKDKPHYYPNDDSNMHLAIGAQTPGMVSKKDQPYQDTAKECEGFDNKLGVDDCTYALRRIYGQCSNTKTGKLGGGKYWYKCVEYRTYGVNCAKGTTC